MAGIEDSGRRPGEKTERNEKYSKAESHFAKTLKEVRSHGSIS
jgi:hypothetical protein